MVHYVGQAFSRKNKCKVFRNIFCALFVPKRGWIISFVTLPLSIRKLCGTPLTSPSLTSAPEKLFVSGRGDMQNKRRRGEIARQSSFNFFSWWYFILPAVFERESEVRCNFGLRKMATVALSSLPYNILSVKYMSVVWMRAWHFFPSTKKIYFRESGSPNSREKHLRNLTFCRRRRQLFFSRTAASCGTNDDVANNLISIFSSLRAGNRCRRHRFPAASESGSRPLETKVVCCVRGSRRQDFLPFFYRRGKVGVAASDFF